MNLGVRTRVFLVTLGLAIVIGLAAGTLLESRLRADLVARAESELVRTTAMLETHLDEVATPPRPAVVDEAVDSLARSAGVRLTVIDASGRVLGESTLDGPALKDMDNHAGRPEVREAREGGHGLARRFSTTVDADMLYVARAAELPDGTPIILRAARPLSEIGAAVWNLRLNLLLSAGLALGAALISATVVSNWMQRTLEGLVARARALQGDPDVDAATGSSVPQLSARLEGALQDLAAERDQREAVLSGVTDAVVAIDRQLLVTLANPAARALLGPDVVGTPLDAEVLGTPARQALDQNAPVTTEVRWPGPPPRELELVVAPLTTIDGAVLVLHDVTEIRRLERVRRDFVTNVSHELRTPVAIVTATSETLLDGAIDDADAARPFTEAVHRHAVRMGRMVDDLLALSRIEAGRLPLDPRPVPLLPLLKRLAEIGAEAAPARRTAPTVVVPDDLCAWVDRSALEHAVGNLIENAVKYVPEHAPIEVRAHRLDDRVLITVTDEGPGIPADHADRVFERFYRVDKGRSREVGGTGLGLSLVRHLVEALGGRVTLTANDPHGCVFTVDLPAEAPAVD